MNRAKKAITENRGLQFIAQLIQEKCDSGLTQEEAVKDIVALLDAFQKEDEQTALALIKHLKEWLYLNSLVKSTEIGGSPADRNGFREGNGHPPEPGNG